MRSIGSGFEVINYPTREVDSGAPDIGIYEEITDEALEVSQKIANQTKPLRGEILTICVDIDYCLGEAISRFFLERDQEKRQIFQDLILDTTFLTLSQKKNIFKLITKKHPEKFYCNEESRTTFFANLDEIILFRNALAHGRIIINYNEKTVMLHYYNSNNNKQVDKIINPEFFEGLRRKIHTVIFDFSCRISEPPSVLIGPEDQGKS